MKLSHQTYSCLATEIGTVPLRVALLDDDVIFGLILTKYAAKLNIQVTIYLSPAEYICGISKFEYDVAVIDYYLDDDIGTKYSCLKENLPVLFTSRDEILSKIPLNNSNNVMGFIRKEPDQFKIVEKIVNVFYESKFKR